MKHIHHIDEKILEILAMRSPNTQDQSLNIKKLVKTAASFRIRSGNIRAIFEIDNIRKIINFWNIAYRGKIY